MIDGVPNCLIARIKKEEHSRMSKLKNHPNMNLYPEVVKKAIWKEEKNHLLFTFSKHMLKYTYNIGIIILGMLVKKPRMYRDCSFFPFIGMNLLNRLVKVNITEPEIDYGTTLHNFCCFLWRLAITFPGKIFDLYNDDVSGAFTQLEFHPDVARANVSIYNNTMIASTACHFRGNFGPASWEPVARARCSLAKWLFMHAVYYKELNQELLILFKLLSGN